MSVLHPHNELVLTVDNLSVSFQHEGERIRAVNDLSLTVRQGETLAIVGESGSGKSVTSLALMRLIEQGGGTIDSGSIWLRRRNQQRVDLTTLSSGQMREIRGADMAMIFQEPMTSLNPVFPIGEQIAEPVRLHQGKDHRQAMIEAQRMLDLVRIPEAKNILTRYPHQLSGGMRQRVMIAMALSCRPRLLLCDEPTTALDVTVQHQVLRLLERLCVETGAALAFVTHDLAVVNQTCTDMAVMYAGHVVEAGRVQDVFRDPRHPYTKGLLDSAPDFDQPDRELVAIPGFPPNVANRPSGCPFAPRCAFAVEACTVAMPPFEVVAPDHRAACIESSRVFLGVPA